MSRQSAIEGSRPRPFKMYNVTDGWLPVRSVAEQLPTMATHKRENSGVEGLSRRIAADETQSRIKWSNMTNS